MRCHDRRRLLPSLLAFLTLTAVGISGVLQGGAPARMSARGPSGLPTGSTFREPRGPLPPPWLGRDLDGLLGPLVTLGGDTLAGRIPAGLQVHLLVSDRECYSCLEEIPRLALRLRELGHDDLPARVVALGDRFEARRTLWGMDHVWPVAVSARSEVPGVLGFQATPLRVITLYSRVLYIDMPRDRSGDPGEDDPIEQALTGWVNAVGGRVPGPAGDTG
jgi:hypothetical protein